MTDRRCASAWDNSKSPRLRRTVGVRSAARVGGRRDARIGLPLTPGMPRPMVGGRRVPKGGTRASTNDRPYLCWVAGHAARDPTAYGEEPRISSFYGQGRSTFILGATYIL